MSTHNVCFCGDIRKTLSGYPFNLELCTFSCIFHRYKWVFGEANYYYCSASEKPGKPEYEPCLAKREKGLTTLIC